MLWLKTFWSCHLKLHSDPNCWDTESQQPDDTTNNFSFWLQRALSGLIALYSRLEGHGYPQPRVLSFRRLQDWNSFSRWMWISFLCIPYTMLNITLIVTLTTWYFNFIYKFNFQLAKFFNYYIPELRSIIVVFEKMNDANILILA